MTLVDAHAHLGPSARFFYPDTSVSRLLALMNRLDIEATIATHQGALGAAVELAEKEVQQAYELSQGRLLAYAVYDPGREDSEERVRALLAEAPYVGIKIHPSLHRVPAEDPTFEAAFRLAAEQNVPILTHSWGRTPENPVQELSFPTRFERWVAAYPQVPLILGHAGGRPDGHRAAVELAERHPNVYLDLSGDNYYLGLVEWLVERAGAERILFGSDLTWIDPRAQLGRVLAASLPEAAKSAILRENARRLFQLPRAKRGKPCASN